MTSNLEFTDKTQETLAAAIQLAKDYANADGVHLRLRRIHRSSLIFSLVNSCAVSHRVRSFERRWRPATTRRLKRG